MNCLCLCCNSGAGTPSLDLRPGVTALCVVQRRREWRCTKWYGGRAGQLHPALLHLQRRRRVLVLVALHCLVVNQWASPAASCPIRPLASDLLGERQEHAMHLHRQGAGRDWRSRCRAALSRRLVRYCWPTVMLRSALPGQCRPSAPSGASPPCRAAAPHWRECLWLERTDRRNASSSAKWCQREGKHGGELKQSRNHAGVVLGCVLVHRAASSGVCSETMTARSLAGKRKVWLPKRPETPTSGIGRR